MAARKSRTRSRRAITRRPATRKVRRASNGGNTWSREEVAFMRKYYRVNETAWVARKLGRTVYSVRYKASDLNIKKSRPSIWRGNTGMTKAKATKKTRRPSTRKAYRAKSTRRTSTRRATTRRTKSRTTRRATSRRTKSRRR